MGSTVFAFRRLRRWALGPRHFVSGRQILTCRLYLDFGSVPSGRMYGIYFFLVLFSRSGGSSLLVINCMTLRVEIIYEGILSLYSLFIHRRRKL